MAWVQVILGVALVQKTQRGNSLPLQNSEEPEWLPPSISDNNGCWYGASPPFNSTGQRSVSWYPCQEVFCNYQGELSSESAASASAVCAERCCLSALGLSSEGSFLQCTFISINFELDKILNLLLYNIRIPFKSKGLVRLFLKVSPI